MSTLHVPQNLVRLNLLLADVEQDANSGGSAFVFIAGDFLAAISPFLPGLIDLLADKPKLASSVMAGTAAETLEDGRAVCSFALDITHGIGTVAQLAEEVLALTEIGSQ